MLHLKITHTLIASHKTLYLSYFKLFLLSSLL